MPWELMHRTSSWTFCFRLKGREIQEYAVFFLLVQLLIYSSVVADPSSVPNTYLPSAYHHHVCYESCLLAWSVPLTPRLPNLETKLILCRQVSFPFLQAPSSLKFALPEAQL